MTTQDWNKEIDELEVFFASRTLPKTITLGKNTILDPKSFIAVQLQFVKRNNGKKPFIKYLKQLQQIKTLLTN